MADKCPLCDESAKRIAELEAELARHEATAKAERQCRTDRAFRLEFVRHQDGSMNLIVCDPAGDDMRSGMIAGAVLSVLDTGPVTGMTSSRRGRHG